MGEFMRKSGAKRITIMCEKMRADQVYRGLRGASYALTIANSTPA